jgi:hypothetical protein
MKTSVVETGKYSAKEDEEQRDGYRKRSREDFPRKCNYKDDLFASINDLFSRIGLFILGKAKSGEGGLNVGESLDAVYLQFSIYPKKQFPHAAGQNIYGNTWGTLFNFPQQKCFYFLRYVLFFVFFFSLLSSIKNYRYKLLILILQEQIIS